MKSLFFLYMFLSFSHTVLAKSGDSTQVLFFTGTFEELTKNAKRINKPIFVDVSTTWCGPCKLMKREAFTNSKVASYLNKNFLCYEIDAEKGQGKFIARNFSVNSYPTLLFITSDSTLFWKGVGYQGIEPFLEVAAKALTVLKDANNLSYYRNKYKSGERSKKFILNYLEILKSLDLPTESILNPYLDSLSANKLASKEILDLISRYISTTNSKGFDMLINSIRQDTVQTQHTEKVASILSDAWWLDYRKAINQHNDVLFERLIDIYKIILRLQLSSQDKLINVHVKNRQRDYYAQTGKLSSYRPLGHQFAEQLMGLSKDSLEKSNLTHYKKFIESISRLPDSTRASVYERYSYSERYTQTNFLANDLNEIALVFLNNGGNKTDLLFTVKLINRAVEFRKISAYVSTQARIFYKLGYLKKSIILQKQAIRLALNEKKDTKGLVEDLDKMTSKIR